MKKIKLIFKLIFLLSIIYLSFTYIKQNFKENDSKILSYVISNRSTSSSKNNNNLLKDIFALSLNNEPVKQLNLFNKEILEEQNKIIINPVTKEELDQIKKIKPIVYIYNTHQTESYNAIETNIYNFTPTVQTASYMLQDELIKYNINSIVEETNIKNILNNRKWEYSYSYRITKELMEQKYKENPTLEIFIDIHRDSISKEQSTVKINNKNYAKIMFLIGNKRSNLDENLKIVKQLELELEKNNPGITRKTYYKDYTYNQDFNNKTFLIELGGDKNTIEEVYNSSVALAKAISILQGD